MGDVVNLRRARKARDRVAAAEAAAHNRAGFGRSKAERQASADATGRRDAILDAHRLEPPVAGPDDAAGE